VQINSQIQKLAPDELACRGFVYRTLLRLGLPNSRPAAEQKWEEEGGRLVARISCPRLPV
jgi:hypothetical protein